MLIAAAPGWSGTLSLVRLDGADRCTRRPERLAGSYAQDGHVFARCFSASWTAAAYPLMLLVCFLWPEVRVFEDA